MTSTRDRPIKALRTCRTEQEIAEIMTRRGYHMSRGLVFQLLQSAHAKIRAALEMTTVEWEWRTR